MIGRLFRGGIKRTVTEVSKRLSGLRHRLCNSDILVPIWLLTFVTCQPPFCLHMFPVTLLSNELMKAKKLDSCSQNSDKVIQSKSKPFKKKTDESCWINVKEMYRGCIFVWTCFQRWRKKKISDGDLFPGLGVFSCGDTVHSAAHCALAPLSYHVTVHPSTQLDSHLPWWITSFLHYQRTEQHSDSPISVVFIKWQSTSLR